MSIVRLLFVLLLVSSGISLSQSKNKTTPRNAGQPYLGHLVLSIEGGAALSVSDVVPGVDWISSGAVDYMFNTDSKYLLGIRVFGGYGYYSGRFDWKGRFYDKKFRTPMTLAGAGLVYQYLSGNGLSPYLFLGTSHIWFDPELSDGKPFAGNIPAGYAKTDNNLMAEAGLKYFLAYNLSVNTGLKSYLNFGDYLDGYRSGSADDWMFSASIGFSWYLFADKDSDHDGVRNRKDACQNTPQGVTVTRNGCPPDMDKDGIADYLDECLSTPAGVRVDAKGCPLDSDGDRIADYLDQCPDTPSGASVDAKGCPLDSDGDGVNDNKDVCKNTPSGVAVDASGCPSDSDRDGVPDYLDKCPGTPSCDEVDSTGCPKEKLVLSATTLFAAGKSMLLSTAFPVLDRLANMMNQYPLSRWRIEGHTDNVGLPQKNKALSLDRAQAVLNYFVGHGFRKERFEVRGFGSEYPDTDNNSEEGRAKNRRVIIIRLD